MRLGVERSGEIAGAVLAARMTLQKLHRALGIAALLFRQFGEQVGGRARVDPDAAQGRDGVIVSLRLIGAGKAQADNPLGVGGGDDYFTNASSAAAKAAGWSCMMK